LRWIEAAYPKRSLAMRFEYLFDFPEYPHKGYTQADDDTEEQQRQTGGCEHLKHA
jgi:hypothetical protein